MKLKLWEKIILLLAIGIFVFGVYRLWQVYESGQEWERKVEEAKEALNKSPKTPKKPVNWDKTIPSEGKG